MFKKIVQNYLQKNYTRRSFEVRDIHIAFKKEGLELSDLRQILRELADEGILHRVRGNRFTMASNLKLFTGRLETFAKGFGFVICEDPNQADIYIDARDIGRAMDGDQVMVRLESSRRMGKPAGTIVRIISRKRNQLVGVLQKGTYGWYLEPDEKKICQDIFVIPKHTHGAKPGQKVVLRLLEDESKRDYLQGEIINILGYPGEQGVDISSLIYQYELPGEFPEKVLKAVEDFDDSKISPAGRLDLRDKQIITIDPADARDLDDAISLEMTPKGNYLLGVHIADVSHYVQEGGPLDKEALHRGTSVYLVDRVIPMLPPALSNGVCSLHPGVDRLTYSCFMEFDPQGRMINHHFADSIIRSECRFDYDEVQEIFDNPTSPLQQEYQAQTDLLGRMKTLALLIRNRRQLRGSIDFNLPEVKVILDEKGKPAQLKREENTLSHQVIEEFMLSANMTVASYMSNRRIPFVYRIHPSPNHEKLMAFADFVRTLNYKLKVTEPMEPREIQRLLKSVAGKPEEHLVNNLMLRTMQEARYSAENVGHFGLSAPFYTHFTSPIRRYPDLVVHRYLRRALQGKMDRIDSGKLTGHLEEICVQSSNMERRATGAERDSVEMKKLEFLENRIGQEFAGVIDGVTGFGLFVEIQEFLVDGLIPLEMLGSDEWTHDEKLHQLSGRKSRKKYRMGDKVRVQIVRVNRQERKMDLALAK